jgi:KDO2-lipid IV(A) lauroyltransferase
MSRQKSSKSLSLQAWFVRSLLRGSAALSWRGTRRLGDGLGWLASHTPNRFHFDSLRNLEVCLPELEPAEREHLARVSLVETCRSIAEIGIMWNWPVDRVLPLERTTTNGHLLEEGMAAGKGVLLLAPHIGNWEFLTHYLMRRHPLTGLYRPPRIAEMDSLIKDARERGGATLLPANRRGLRDLLQTLRAGGLVAILPDQQPRHGQGVFAPFFHLPALTLTLVASLLRRVPAEVVFAWAQRRSDGFDVHFLKAPEGLDDPDDVVAATRLNLGVEACVRACPEQYTWSYRRFRSRPPEESRAVARGEPPKVLYKGWEN